MSQVKITSFEGDVTVERHLTAGGDATIRGEAVVKKDLKVGGWLDAPNVKVPNKGIFSDEDSLRAAYPKPLPGWWALVGKAIPYSVYLGVGKKWVDSGVKASNIDDEAYGRALVELREQYANIKEELEGVKDEAGSNAGDIGNLSRDVKELKDITGGMYEGLSRIDEELSQSKRDINNLWSETGHIAQDLEADEIKIAEHERLIKNLDYDLKVLKGAMTLLEQLTNAHDGLISELAENINELSDEVVELRKEVSKGADLTEVEEKIRQLRTDLEAKIAAAVVKGAVVTFKGIFNSKTATSDFTDNPGVWWDSENGRFFRMTDSGAKASTWEVTDETPFPAEYYGELVIGGLSGRRPDTAKLFVLEGDKSLWWYDAKRAALLRADDELYKNIEQLNVTYQQLQGMIASVGNLASDALAEIEKKQDALTNSTDITVSGSELSLTEQAKRAVFDDMWKAAFGKYGDVDHSHMENGKPAPYYGNELWLTYEEALVVDYVSTSRTLYKGAGSFCFGISSKYKPRTLYPMIFHGGANTADFSGAFQGGTYLEKIRFGYDDSDSYIVNQGVAQFQYAFSGLKNLTHILGVINISNTAKETAFPSTAFGGCKLLEEVRLARVFMDVNLQDCAKLSAESIKYLITNRKNTNVFTVTLHPDVYAKITAEEGDYAGIMDLAESKNVSLASA